jgi:hypothetical protein
MGLERIVGLLWAIADSESYRGMGSELIGCVTLLAGRRATQHSVSPRRTVCAALLAAPVLVAACGARGPLDVVVVEEPPGTDAGAGADVSSPLDGQPAPEAAPEGGPSPSRDAAGPPGFDAGGLLACGGCLAQNCSMQIQACIGSTTCLSTATCAVTMCLSGGAPNVGCILQQCADGGLASFADLVGLFTCVATNCSGCLGALGGLVGGGFPGGTGGTGGGG